MGGCRGQNLDHPFVLEPFQGAQDITIKVRGVGLVITLKKLQPIPGDRAQGRVRLKAPYVIAGTVYLVFHIGTETAFHVLVGELFHKYRDESVVGS